MKNNCAKLFLCLLALGMTASSVISCGDTAENPGTDTVTGEATTEAVTEAEIPDDLPEYDAKGETFTVNCDENDLGWLYEEIDGDIVDDAIYYRDLAVKERFNVDIEYVGDLDYSNNAKRITQSVTAGDDAYQLCVIHAVNTCNLALEGYFLNWYDVPHVNFSKPWWAASTTEDLSHNDVCFLAVGDYVMNALSNTYCMFYNKTLAENYDIPDIYTTVFDGKWTMDTLVGITKDIYQDLNSNGVKDDDDFFGMASDGRSNVETYLWAFGSKVINKGSDGALTVDYYNEKTIDIVNTLCAAYHDNLGLRMGGGWHYGANLFSESRTVFANGLIGHAGGFRELADDYGIIPYPKWDEAQKEYHTMVDGSHGVLCIPNTCGNVELTGIMIEALNAETHKSVVPAYYETSLKDKYARDQQSIELLDLIVSSRVFDMGYIYDGWSGVCFFLEKLVPNNDNNLASLWTTNEKKVTDHYQEVIDYFNDYKG